MKIIYRNLIYLTIIIISFFIFQIKIGILASFISLHVFLHLIQNFFFSTQYINRYTSNIKLTYI